MARRWRVGLREAVALVVVALIAAATVLTGSLGGEALARVERTVQDQWRPVYDLVVVPAGTDVVRDVGGEQVIQANFMASLPNGISLDQWRTIKDLPGVDVAAPVANLGYFSRNQNYYTFDGFRPGIYSVERTVSWDNGLDVRQAGHAETNPIPDRTRGCTEQPPFVVGDQRGDIFKEVILETLVTGFPVGLPRFGEHPVQWRCQGLDPGGVFTVFGIDPREEDRLVGIGDALTSGEQLDPRVGLAPVDYVIHRRGTTSRPLDMPMLFADAEWVDSTFRIEFSRWQTGPYDLGDLLERSNTEACARRQFREEKFLISRAVDRTTPKCLDRALQRRLAAAPRQVVVDTELPGAGGRTLVQGHWEDGKWQTRSVPGVEVGRYLVASASDQSYEPAEEAPDGDWVGAVRAVPTGSYGPEPTYREQLPAPTKKFLRYQQSGTYDPGHVADQFTAQSQWLPEGTYQVPQAIARFDADGDPVEPADLRPTGNALGYLVQPPQALTTLKASRQLVGKTPISAIRVRLSGVETAGEESWQRIEDAVRRIRETTGLEVIATAGSSPAQVLVELPGITAAEQPSGVVAWDPPSTDLFDGYVLPPPAPARTVEGFGWIEEQWLVEGASVRYLRASAASHLWLLGVIGVAGLVYLAAAFTSLGLGRIPIIAIRRAVGWSRTRVFATELGRAGLLGLAGALLGTGIGVAGARLGGLDLDPRLVWVAAPVAVLVSCLAAAWPAWRVSGVPLAAALSGAEVAVTTGTGRRRGTKVQRVPTMAVVELWRLRTRAWLAVVSGTVAVGAIMTLTSVRGEFAGSLQVTLLGRELLVATGPLQQAATYVAVGLAVLMLAELLWQAVRDRRREIGMLRAVGWGRQHVVGLMVWQGVMLGALAAVLGTLGTAGLLVATVLQGGAALPLLAATIPWAALAGVVLGAAAAGIPAWAAARIPPAESLRTT